MWGEPQQTLNGVGAVSGFPPALCGSSLSAIPPALCGSSLSLSACIVWGAGRETNEQTTVENKRRPQTVGEYVRARGHMRPALRLPRPSL